MKKAKIVKIIPEFTLNRSSPRSAMLLGFALTIASAQAATFVLDPFDDGGVSEGADPLDVAWTTTSGNPLTVVNTGTLPRTGNALNFDSSGNFRQNSAMLPTNTGLNLGVGQSIIFSFNFVYTQTPTTANNRFRFGLVSASGFGTAAIAGGNADASLGIFNDITDNGEDFSGAGGAEVYGGPGDTSTAGTMTSGLMADNVTTAMLSITRTSLTQLDISASLNGATASVTDIDGPEASDFITDFSGGIIVIRNGNTNSDFRFDDVRVEVVPEPSSALLGALGVLCLLRRRR